MRYWASIFLALMAILSTAFVISYAYNMADTGLLKVIVSLNGIVILCEIIAGILRID